MNDLATSQTRRAFLATGAVAAAEAAGFDGVDFDEAGSYT